MEEFCVYIMSSQSGTLYVGMTNDIKKRMYQHKNHLVRGFTEKYNIDKLIYIERFTDADSAAKRETQLKKWRREKKIALIDSQNPGWEDLSRSWF